MALFFFFTEGTLSELARRAALRLFTPLFGHRSFPMDTLLVFFLLHPSSLTPSQFVPDIFRLVACYMLATNLLRLFFRS